MKRSRGKNLDDRVIENIVNLLDGWSGRLSWPALLDKIEKQQRLQYTRQTLSRHERIRSAFNLRKKALRGRVAKLASALSPELQASMERIERLKAENLRLETENLVWPSLDRH